LLDLFVGTSVKEYSCYLIEYCSVGDLLHIPAIS
jgi:hypothetical protein